MLLKKMRNNNKASKTTKAEAKEIINFWDKCSKDIIGEILR